MASDTHNSELEKQLPHSRPTPPPQESPQTTTDGAPSSSSTTLTPEQPQPDPQRLPISPKDASSENPSPDPCLPTPKPPEFELPASLATQPHRWPLWYRLYCVATVSFATWIVILHSTSYTAAIPGVMEQFGIKSKSVATLGLTSYLLGLAAGSVVVAPASEVVGRRAVYLVCWVGFLVFILGCLSTSLTQLIILRFIGALFGAALLTNSPGTIVDLSDASSNPTMLARFNSLYSIAPLNGPVTGPLIGGFVFEYLGWRWENWVSLSLAGVAGVMLLLVKETYPPVLMRREVLKKRKETGDERWWCRYDRDEQTWQDVVNMVASNLARPFKLAATEPILWFFNIWLSLTYGVLYLCFIAYPIIFTSHRHWSPSQTGLSFLGIGVGTLLSILLEPIWRKYLISPSPKRDPDNPSLPAPEATALVMSLGSVLTAVGQLLFAWTCLPRTIHPLIPIAVAGVPFGMGNTLSFIYGSNYLAASYGEWAASALAGNAVARSVMGAFLPLAGPSMYGGMGPRWAGMMLGVLEVVLIPVPVGFYFWGDKIRERSRVIEHMRNERRRREEKEKASQV